MLISVRLKKQHVFLHKEGREMKIKYEVTKSYPLIAAKLLWAAGMRTLVAVVVLSLPNDYDLYCKVILS
jgi:hypothetical protein